MNPHNSFKKTLSEALSIVLIALVLGLVYNSLSCRGIALIREVKKISLSFDTTKVSSIEDYAVPMLITLDDAYKIYREGQGVFMDTRDDEDFVEGHIKGAISLPLQNLEKNPALVRDIPKDKLIVTYCSGVECALSIDLAKKLASMGFTNVKVFFAGWPEWHDKKLPAETGPKDNL